MDEVRVLRLLRAIEGCVDVAQHLCAVNRLGPPSDNGDAMTLLGAHGVLDRELSVSMRRAVGFRNVPVHEYVAVDDDVVRLRVRDHRDIADFVSAVARLVRS